MVHDCHQHEERVHLLVGVVSLHGVPVDQVWPVGVDQGAECLARVILIRDLLGVGIAYCVVRTQDKEGLNESVG